MAGALSRPFFVSVPQGSPGFWRAFGLCRSAVLDKGGLLGLGFSRREVNEVSMFPAASIYRTSNPGTTPAAACGVMAAGVDAGLSCGSRSSFRLWWRCSLLLKGVARA